MHDALPRRGPSGPAGAFPIQVLVDADNVTGSRLRTLLDVLRGVPTRIVAAGARQSLNAIRWPETALLLPREGWQRADVALAAAYTPTRGPLVIASGDGDFALLAARHPGPVLVVSEAASARLRSVAPVVDPIHDGIGPLAAWVRAFTAG
jgi:hypothetical protein